MIVSNNSQQNDGGRTIARVKMQYVFTHISHVYYYYYRTQDTRVLANNGLYYAAV